MQKFSMSIAAKRAPFVDSVLLISSFAVSMDDVTVDVGPSHSNISPPIVYRTRFGSDFTGLKNNKCIANNKE